MPANRDVAPERSEEKVDDWRMLAPKDGAIGLVPVKVRQDGRFLVGGIGQTANRAPRLFVGE
jgi:hypothetical protein